MPHYEVQSGDTLSAIARDHQVSIAALRAENPRIKDADHIEAGWTLSIPPSSSGAVAMPEPKTAGQPASSECAAKACRTEYADIIHEMGAGDEAWCLALPDAAAEELYREIEEMDALMAEFRAAQNKAQDPGSDQPSPERQWMIKAAEKGVIQPDSDDQEEQEPDKVSPIRSRIAAIDEQIRWFDDYDTDYIWSAISADDEKREEILTTARNRRLAMLRKQREALQAQLEETDTNRGVRGQGVQSRDFDPRRSNRVEAGIIEIMVFSRPGRWHYVRKGVYRRILASYASIRYVRKTRAMADMLSNKSATARELIGKIRDDLKTDAAKSPIGNIEVKFAEAKEDFYLLGKEHSKLTWNSSKGEAPSENQLQVGAEAQLMRFAMQASAGVNNFDLSTGEIDIGTRASASMALLEAEAKLAEVFVPDEAGWDCRFTFRNRNGELSDLAFGAFRLSGDITLNCFVGGRAGGEANARLSTGAATFLLSDQKSIKPDPNAGLSVSGNAFAGAEAGGAVSGKFSWVHPDEQFNTNANWQELLKIEAGATVAAGVGAGMDFGLEIDRTNILMKCSGRLVFGPGASGSFGTTVELGNCWNLCRAVFSALSQTDYSYLANVDGDLFRLWSQNLYLSLTNDLGKAADWFNQPLEKLYEAWDQRRKLKDEAETLAARIRSGRLENVLEGDDGSLTLYSLPPETMGILCHTLLHSFFESAEEEQERALIFILSHVTTWRKFFEVLQHMTADGSPCNAMKSLEKICAILDDGYSVGDNQLRQFHEWVHSELAVAPEDMPPKNIAWKPSSVRKNWNRVREKLLAYEQRYAEKITVV
ncbi:LysM peptidoglycan-binding domain-containing protein [Marinobacter koreensis]|uniref:LysM peptidoglycan-binding domain-containing protein n=1 Tax=Marinobacter koreensis TaxID=335974 RepID=A0ABW0RNK0_9GAMM|nr:LysM domain-containing protein [Marinobacter koreensis]MCK7549455.1 LysM peptidoglycan-binding domain-containing protein [Marinobacter koreensis]